MISLITLDDLSIIKDVEMKLALFNYLSNLEYSNTQKQYLYHYIKLFKDLKLSELTRLTFCDIWDNIDSKTHLRHSFCKINLCFIAFLIKNNLYNKSSDIKDFEPFIKQIEITSSATIDSKLLLNKDKSLSQFFVFSYDYKDYKNGGIDKINSRIIDTNCQNKFIVHLLSDFYNSNSFGTKNKRQPYLATEFINSYEDIKNFNSISDFNYYVFESQFEYYKHNRNALGLLIKFYYYLHINSNGKDIFKVNDPIDINLLQRTDFIEIFQNGFRLVHFNPYEEIPKFNKWIIKPNDFEMQSTKLKPHTYTKFDFTEIDNELYIDLLKQYVWETSANLVTKRNNTYLVIKFLNFLNNFKSNFIGNTTKNIDCKTVTAVEMYSYRSNLETSNLSLDTKNTYYKSIRNFLNFCKDKEILNIESAVFEYLNSHCNYIESTAVSIPDDELSKLEEHLRNLADENLIQNLYYIIFHLAIETEFRISQILSLRISEIKEGMKENQFYIHSTTKVSNQDKIDQHITAYAKRHLDIAIKHTESLRIEANEENKDYIFLFKGNGTVKDIRPINTDAFTTYLKKQCKNLGLKEYTAANLRDTHMTKAIEYGFKMALTDLEIQTLTNHKKSSTTNKHYVDANTRTFAEATYGVIVGDIDIKGNIINKINNEFTNKDVVDNGCGYCKENSCKVFTELGCPMCDGFVVTLDRIPFYEQKIKELDHRIENESIAHEREHLYTIKRLYVAYLERLYTLKKEV